MPAHCGDAGRANLKIQPFSTNVNACAALLNCAVL